MNINGEILRLYLYAHIFEMSYLKHYLNALWTHKVVVSAKLCWANHLYQTKLCISKNQEFLASKELNLIFRSQTIVINSYLIFIRVAYACFSETGLFGLAVSVPRHFGQTMESSRNLTCSLLNANKLKSTKGLFRESPLGITRASVTFHLSDCFITSLRHQREFV